MSLFRRRGLGSSPGQVMWDLWWDKVELEQVFLQVFRFSPLSIIALIAPPTLYVLVTGIVVKQCTSTSRTKANPRLR